MLTTTTIKEGLTVTASAVVTSAAVGFSVNTLTYGIMGGLGAMTSVVLFPLALRDKLIAPQRMAAFIVIGIIIGILVDQSGGVKPDINIVVGGVNLINEFWNYNGSLRSFLVGFFAPWLLPIISKFTGTVRRKDERNT